MSKYTTAKITRPTLRILVRFKALIERIGGNILSLNETIAFSTIVADWHISKKCGFTKDDLMPYMGEMVKAVKETDEKAEMESLVEQMEAYGVLE